MPLKKNAKAQMTEATTATDDEVRDLLRRLHRERPDDFKRVASRVRRALSRALVRESLVASEASLTPQAQP